MTPKRQFCVGAVGTGLTALCCFTPILAVVLGALGLSTWLAWLDLVLLPLLILFGAVTILALIRLKGAGQRQSS